MSHDPQPARPALFLDRDGTLIADRGDLCHPSQVEFIPGVIDLLAEVHQHFVLFIVTNQSGVGEGRLTLEQVARVNQTVVERLADHGIPIERVFVCPHAVHEGCSCRKPKPEFLRIAVTEHSVDLARSFTIGDHASDVEFGEAVGARGIYVLTGHGLAHRSQLGPGRIVVPSLPDARTVLLDGVDPPAPSELHRAACLLRSGQVAAFPTETVYGLGANCLDPKAVARVFEIKRRPSFDPLIVHISEMSWVERLVSNVSPLARVLMDRFWPGPLTLVLPKTDLVPDLVTAGLPSVALRMPSHPLALELIRQAGVPICAPSANPFGYVSPTCASHVLEQLGATVDCVLDGGCCSVGIESTIVGFDGSTPRVLRLGQITPEQIADALGLDSVAIVKGHALIAPGMLPRHYSPRVEVRLFDGTVPLAPAIRTGLLLQSPLDIPDGYAVHEVLSQTGDPAECAQNLFAALRRLDRADLSLVYAQRSADDGIGRAINDRLQRASCRVEPE